MEAYFIASLCLSLLLYILYEVHFENQHVEHYEQLKVKHAFYCSQCNIVYTCLEDADVAACPKCSQDNSYIKF